MNKKDILKLIPYEWRFKITNLKNKIYKGFSKRYYSQNGEDIVLSSIFNNQKTGFYVDVGAHHPRRYSNTYLLHKKGWQGINIDPNPYTIKLFNKERPDDINLLAGVSLGEEKELTYYSFSDPAINTFSKENAEKYLNKSWVKLMDSKKVPVFKLSKILENNLKPNQKIDLLSVDVEGLDLQVLKSNNWDSFIPKIIVVEDHLFSISNLNNNEIYSFLSQKGYKLHSAISYSLIFTR